MEPNEVAVAVGLVLFIVLVWTDYKIQRKTRANLNEIQQVNTDIRVELAKSESYLMQGLAYYEAATKVMSAAAVMAKLDEEDQETLRKQLYAVQNTTFKLADLNNDVKLNSEENTDE